MGIARWVARKIRHVIFGVVFALAAWALAVTAFGYAAPVGAKFGYLSILSILAMVVIVLISAVGVATLTGIGRILQRSKDVERIVKEFERQNQSGVR